MHIHVLVLPTLIRFLYTLHWTPTYPRIIIFGTVARPLVRTV